MIHKCYRNVCLSLFESFIALKFAWRVRHEGAVWFEKSARREGAFFWELLFEKNRSCLISNLSPETYIFTPKSNKLREVHTAVPIFFWLFLQSTSATTFHCFKSSA